jgi:cardiolipin synthase (CMP-forming)
VVLQEEELVVVERPNASGDDPASTEVDHSHDIFSVANVITVLRLVLIPFFYWFLVFSPPPPGQPNTVAFTLFVLAAGTDWLDGYIARRTGTVTAIGKIIDPLVDRLLIAAALVGLLAVKRVELWLVVVLIGRDVYLLYGAWLLERHGRRVAVTPLGKATTAVLLTGFAGLVWNTPIVVTPTLVDIHLLGGAFVLGGVQPLGTYIVYVGVVLSVSAAVQYTVIARRAYREAIAEEKRRVQTG